MGGETDVLQWLLPDAPAAEEEHARRLITFVRLLRDDARSRRSGTVGVELPGAREELERLGHEGAVELCEELLRFHLRAALELESWSDFGAPRRALQDVWSRVESLRARGHDVPGVPAPGEAPLEVAQRILAVARRNGASEAWSAIWSARLVRVTAGPEAGERAWCTALAEAEERDWGWAVAATALAGVAHALLDRGDVRRAHEELSARLVLLSVDEELAWLFAWTALLLGDLERARETTRGRAPRTGTLPLPLHELRERVPDWLRFLPGTRPSAGAAPTVVERAGSRGAFHASVFGVFVLETDRELRVLAFDAAPGVRDTALRALERREGAWTRSGEPEQRVLVEGQPVILHGGQGVSLRGALGGEGTRALELIPLLDDEGEAIGWIHLECEHHLLPALPRALAHSRAWQTAAVEARGARDERTSAPAFAAQAHGGPPPQDARTVWADSVLERLGVKLARRRAYLFDERLALVHEVGGALADWRDRGGGRRALRRSLRTAGQVVFDAPEPSLGVHAAAASGCVVPLVVEGRVRGLLVFESTRRSDFRRETVDRIAARLAQEAWGWRTAQFRTWHRAEFEADVHFDPTSRAWRERLRDLVAIARARMPVAVVGPEGAGKETFVRWLRFEGDDPGRPVTTRRESAVDALEIFVPPLQDRRDEIPGLVSVLSSRIARREGVPAPTWSDEALALLWRQPWRGNVRELETFLARVVLASDGGEVGAAELAELARRARRALRHRMPSRRPRREDLEAALATTAHAKGTWNKTRAALYLGWDPDTLVLRLSEKKVRGASRVPR